MRRFLPLLLLCACDDDPGAVVDAAPDVAADAAPDVALDGPPDAAPDASADAARDAIPDAPPDMGPPPSPVVISEVMAKNEGAWVDEVGETDDWIELHNRSEASVDLTGWRIGDDPADVHPIPPFETPQGIVRRLPPGGHVVLWADRDLEQGSTHLPFKVSSGGETLYLFAPGRVSADTVELGESAPNDVWGRYGETWRRCAYATPGRANGETCGPPPPPEVPEEVVFADYTWSEPWPFPPTPLAISEIALRPAGFVEIYNPTDEGVLLSDYHLRVGPHRPGEAWPARGAGSALAWPVERLEPGARVAVEVTEAQVALLAANAYEGVVTLWADGRNFPVERVDFMAWPEGAALTRIPDGSGRHRYCARTTPGAENADCEPLVSRAVGERLRHLRTPGDFEALAEGGTAVGIASVKFVIDLEGGGAVHLLSTRAWDLHYTFVRERIDSQPHLSRCDPDENRLFVAGWRAFSEINYVRVEGRRYLLGTLVHHGGADVRTVEYTGGDRIVSGQMRQGFFAVMAHVQTPQRWSLRPQTARQVEELREIEGEAPMVGPSAPFRGVTYQALTATVGYGVLTFVPTEALATAPLGPQVIVVTDQVPNDIALTGGLVTEAFQTPLAHVNLLSRNRNTPNMALVDARADDRVAPYLGQLVRLEVAGASFDIRPAEPAEAEAFWASRRPGGPPAEPRLDPEVRGVQPLVDHGIASLPAVGAKAAQLAELATILSDREGCEGLILTPLAPMAIPVVHSLEHYAASGALAHLETLRSRPDFRTDPAARAAGLAEVRALVTAHPVAPALLADVEAYVATHYGDARVRFRSSSNTEDLPGFNGAGLYTSISGQIGDPSRSIEDAIRIVWASLWLSRGYDERDYHNIAQDGVAMGILVHPAFLSERQNGVVISRNVLEPIREQYYLNAQIGEASVTNPAPGVGTEQVLYDFRRQPRVRYLGRSTLTGGAAVMSSEEIVETACTLRAIHDHFRPLLDPDRENRWFAMDIEFKRLGDERALLVKQARPYSFGAAEVPEDCREL